MNHVIETSALFYIVSILVAALAPSPLRPIFDAWLRKIQRDMGESVTHSEEECTEDPAKEETKTEETK